MTLLRNISGLLAVCGVVAVIPIVVSAEEVVRSFEAVAEIQTDGDVHITETIGYDFDDAERRGIFRTIPLTYQFEDDTYELEITDIVVSSPTGAPSNSFTERRGEDLRVRIGDPDVTITGAHQYVIEYTVGNVLRAHTDTYELYWNATGNDWDVPIESSEITVILPEDVSSDLVQYDCYEGVVGSTDSCGQTEQGGGEDVLPHFIFSSEDLGPGEGITAAVEFPNTIISDYTQTPRESDLLLMLGVGAAAASILGGFLFWFWYQHGRDPKGRGVIVRQYDPPKDLTPAETGVVVDERIHDRDITAEIVHLARKGYIHILALSEKVFLFTNTPYLIFKMREPDSTLKEHEALILEKMFQDKYDKDPEELFNEIPKQTDVDRETLEMLARKSIEFIALKDLERSFHKDLRVVKKTLYDNLTQKGYFERNPQKIIKKFGLLSIVLFVGVWLFMMVPFMSQFMGVVITVFLIVYAFMSWYVLTLVKKTPKGVAAKEHGLGLRQYLSMAEKERLEFHFDPRKNSELFEKLLPYAIALKVDKQWAEQFEEMHQEEPSWYTGSQGQAFSSTAFVSNLSGFSNAARAAGTSSSGSSGGGFSGGGAGGGGGGSW